MNEMYEPVFSDPPTSCAEWWMCLRRFVAGWYGAPVGELGHRPKDARDLAATLSRDLPPTIDEWSSLHADLASVGCFNRAFRDNYALDWRADLDAVTLLIQAEQDLYWGVPVSRLDQPDPPVETWLIDHETEGTAGCAFEPSKPWTDSITMFVLEHLLSYLYAPGAGFDATVDDVDDVANELTMAMPIRFDAGRITIFEDEDAIVVIRRTWSPDDRPEVHVSGEFGESRRGNLPHLIERLAASGGMRHGFLA